MNGLLINKIPDRWGCFVKFPCKFPPSESRFCYRGYLEEVHSQLSGVSYCQFCGASERMLIYHLLLWAPFDLVSIKVPSF